MDPPVIIAGIGLLLGSVVLSIGIDRVIRRAGAGPADEGERSGGIRDVAARLQRWQEQRTRDRK